MSEQKTLADVIRKIVQDHGEKALLDSQFTLAVFMDLAPTLKKERELLRAFLLCDGAKKVLDSRGLSSSERDGRISALIQQIANDHWVAESAAKLICDEFYYGVTGAKLVVPVATPKESVSLPKPEPKKEENLKSSPPDTQTQQYTSNNYSNSINWSKVIWIAIGIIAAILLLRSCFGSANKKEKIEILTSDFIITVGETAEVCVNSTTSNLKAKYNNCISTGWIDIKASGGKYYLSVLGVAPGTCTLRIQSEENESIYDTMTITVVANDADDSTHGSDGNDVTTDETTEGAVFSKEHSTKTNAIRISVNTTYTDALSEAKSNWYKFSIDEAGMLFVSLDHLVLESSYSYWEVYLYREDGNTQFDGGSGCWSVSGDANLDTCNIGLPAGNYYLKVSPYSSSRWDDSVYTFSVNFTSATDWEKELNNSKYDATSIELNSKYWGSITNADDRDWYSFTLPSNGSINIAFEHDPIESTYSYWEMYIYRDDGSTYYDGGSGFWSVSGEEGLTTCNIGLTAGTYYVKIAPYSSSRWDSGNYSFLVNYTSLENWEKELNNNKYDASSIDFNKCYYGSITNADDRDWFIFTQQSDGFINIAFEHDFLKSNYTYWEIYIYRDDGTTYYDGGSNFWSVSGEKGITTCNIGLSAGTYYLKVAPYSSSRWDSSTYNLTVNYSAEQLWESELNNNKYDAENLSINLESSSSGIHGSISGSDDRDWYTFSLSQTDSITVEFEHDTLDSSYTYWEIYIFQEDGSTAITNQSCWSVPGSANTLIEGLTLGAGTYYIKIAPYSSSRWSSATYLLKVK